MPREHLGMLGMLYEEGEVLERRDDETGVTMTLNLSSETEARFRKKVGSAKAD